MALLDSIVSRFGRGAPEATVVEASRVPYALRYSKFKTPEEFEAAGRQLGDRWARATNDAERAAIQQEINALQSAMLKFEGAPVAKGAAFGQGPISPNERMVLQSKYGEERVLDPRTGYPQSASGQPLKYDYTDPFMEAGKRMGQLEGRPAQSPSGFEYLYKPSLRLGVDGKPVTVSEYGFTPGQRLAQVGAGGAGAAVLGGAAMRDREGPMSNYTGDAVDAEALMRRYGNQPTEEAPAAQSGALNPLVARALQMSGMAPMQTRYGASDMGMNAFSRPQVAAAPAAAPAARSADVIPPPPQRPQREEQGFLSRAMGKIYDPDYQKGASSRELFQAAQADPDNKGAYFRAVERAREEGEGRATGGAANGKMHKDAALHKALEIIQLMLSRR
jgi:hypothetical protein